MSLYDRVFGEAEEPKSHVDWPKPRGKYPEDAPRGGQEFPHFPPKGKKPKGGKRPPRDDRPPSGGRPPRPPRKPVPNDPIPAESGGRAGRPPKPTLPAGLLPDVFKPVYGPDGRRIPQK